MQGSMLIIL